MKTRYFLFLSYKGTAYHGWQIQPHSKTIQEVLENALSTVLNEKISTTGAGRTDTGVHARFFCVHFESLIPDLETKKKLIFRLNSFLPKDIAVNSVRKVLADASARYSAISRTYKYYISRVKNPFTEDSSWYVYGSLDILPMNEACKILLKYSDFTSFSRLHSDTKTNICKIFEAEWIQDGNQLVFRIKADRFLRNMVRAIVGTLLEVGTGKKYPEDFENVINAMNRSAAGKSAPAHGLFLVDIEYPEEIFAVRL